MCGRYWSEPHQMRILLSVDLGWRSFGFLYYSASAFKAKGPKGYSQYHLDVAGVNDTVFFFTPLFKDALEKFRCNVQLCHCHKRPSRRRNSSWQDHPFKKELIAESICHNSYWWEQGNCSQNAAQINESWNLWHRVGPGKKIYNPWKKNLRVSPPRTPGKKI